MMNEHQTRARWATALRELAQSIEAGIMLPSSMDIWTQYATIEELLAVADRGADTALRIDKDRTAYMVRVPTGKLLDLNITWHVHTKSDPAREDIIDNHNSTCVVPDFVPAGLNDTSEN